MSKALRGFQRWHGKKREPIVGRLNIDYPDRVYPVGKVKEIIYQSTKWHDYPDPAVKRLISNEGTADKNSRSRRIEILNPADIEDNFDDLEANPEVRRYHHRFSGLLSPTLYVNQANQSATGGITPPKLAGELYCLGTCEGLRIKDGRNGELFSCIWSGSMLPIILGSDEMGSVLVFYIPSKNQFGLLKGGAFYISSRGLVF